MNRSKHVPFNNNSRFRAGVATAIAALTSIAMLLAFSGTAEASPEFVSLGNAGSFAVLAGTGITNTGATTISGNIGSYPTGSETGFSTLTLNGTNYPADTTSQSAQTSLVTAYNFAAAEGPQTAIAGGTLGVETLTSGIYNSPNTIQLNGPLTLNGAGNANAVFIFQAGSGLTSASASDIILENGAQACNVFWQVGSSATLGTGSSFQGTILASASITLGTSAVVDGRLLANTGDVTLDTNTVTVPTCAAVSSSPTTSPTPTPTPTPPPSTITSSAVSNVLPTLGNSVNDVVTVAGNSTNGTPTGSVQFYVCGPGSTVCSSSTGTALAPSEVLNGGIANSPNYTPSAIGNYCFASVYTPASGSPYASSSEDGTITNGECFTATAAVGIVPVVTPPVSVTTSVPSNTKPTLGTSVNDVAKVAGNLVNGTPTGSVQFYICGPGSILCSSTTGTLLAPSEALVGGFATSPSFTPSAVGTYCFASVYTPASGSPYLASSEAGSGVNGECITVNATTVAAPIVIPPTHTGKPWSGWPWWAGTAVLGIGGLALVIPWRARRNLRQQR